MIDNTNKKILSVLQGNGRISNVDLANALNLSPTASLARVRQLEEDGYILGYSACLNPNLLDASLLTFIKVSLKTNTSQVLEKFSADIKPIPEVLECFLVAGTADYLIKARVKDAAAQRHLLAEIRLMAGDVRHASMYMVIEEVKHANNVRIQ